MSDRENELKELEEKLKKENRIIREELEKKRKERRIEERIQQLQQEKEDMEYEIEHGISPEEKNSYLEQVERKFPTYPTPSYPRKDIWL